MVGQTPKDTPFGLDANVAAGLAYLLGVIGGIVMLVGGGTNKFVKWAACQSIVAWVAFFVLDWMLTIALSVMHLWMLIPLIGLLALALWLYTSIFAFQGKEVRLPVVGDLTQNIFKSMLA